ncbi:hypothetical protein V6N11_057985 [Hibiscus sabdariffa]|uniref:Uncharacterized protein n=1 Tax=Hibiscus sabdariffa TaxID=183260 RepID=A0ABR2P4K1_9ROSI
MFGNVDFPVLSSSPALERHGSPPPAEEQRATKKVKNRLDEIDGMHLTEVHEAGLDVGSDEPMGDGEGDGDQPVHVNSVEAVSEASLGVTRSYATAVSGSKAAKETVKSVPNSDDIVVLDEDVFVDEKMCGGSSGEQGSLVARGGHSFPFSGDKRHEVTTEELYGPWMVAGDRKRRPRKQLVTDKGMNLNNGKSRFNVLATEAAEADVPEVGVSIPSVAHVSTKAGPSLTSGKRANVQGVQSSTHVAIDTELDDVVVEPMVPGRTLLVIGSSSGLLGRHKAVTIVDDGFDLEGGKRGGFKKGLSSPGKLRLQVRKQSAFKAPNLPRLSEWINTLPSREGADKQTPVVTNSASAQADPPDPIAPFQNMHENGPGASQDDSEMAQVVDMNRPGQTLEC